MKKLMLLFGLVAFIGTANLSYASSSSEDISVSLDCDKCKNHKCDEACKKDGCKAEKCMKSSKEGTASASKKACSKSCSHKEGAASADATKKSCCKKGSAASCSKKKATTSAEK